MSTKQHKISFEVNRPKAIEAVLYILNRHPKKRVDMYNVLKSLFEADKFHLNQHGRPVTGDTYIRMDRGTVPSFVYDAIKRAPDEGMRTERDEPTPFDRDGHDLIARRESDTKHLSKSDIEALEIGMKAYLHLPFGQVEKKNHEEKCWKVTARNKPIDFELIIENEEILEYLKSMPFKQAI